jgi:hypothetical protein
MRHCLFDTSISVEIIFTVPNLMRNFSETSSQPRDFFGSHAGHLVNAQVDDWLKSHILNVSWQWTALMDSMPMPLSSTGCGWLCDIDHLHVKIWWCTCTIGG